MNKVCAIVCSTLWSTVLAVTLSGAVVANVHQDVAPLGEAVADRIVEQPQAQTDLLQLVREFKREQQQLVELVTQLSAKAQQDESFFSRFFTHRGIESKLQERIETLKAYQQRFATAGTLSKPHKEAFAAAIDTLLGHLQQVLSVDGEAKASALQSLSDVIQQSQQRDVSRKQLTLPATPYTLKEQVLPPGDMPAVGSAPYYVNPQALPKTLIRRKRDLAAVDSALGIPERPGRAACYKDGHINPEDFTATPEVQLTDSVKDLAKSLDHSPLKIFNYVANQFDYELYQGSVKGALGVLSSKAGNDTDHASLLIALLRASGYPARYVRGSIEFDPTRKEHLNWVKIKELQNAAYILSNTGKKIAVEKSNEGVPTFQVDHVWVEACIPYAHYRGTRQDDSGYQWLSLDASYKRHKLRAGIKHEVTFDYDSFLKQRGEALAHELYEEQIEQAIKAEHPNATINDVGHRWTRQQRHYTHIPESLPYRVANYSKWSDTHTSSSIATLPANYRKQMFIEINGTQKTTLNLLDSTQKRVTLSFEGATARDQQRYRRWQQGKETLTCPTTLTLKPVIKLDGVTVPSRNAMTLPLCQGQVFNDLEVKISVGLSEGAEENRTITYDGISPLNYHALQAYGFQSSDHYLEKRTARLISAINSTANPWEDPDSIVGEYLDVVLLKYMRYINDGMRYLGNLDSRTTFGGHHIGLTSTQAKVEYLFDLPLALNATNLLVDVPGAGFISERSIESKGIDETFKLAGVLASQYESYIWQENAERDAVSTISGLQIAHQQQVPVKTFTDADKLKGWLTRCAVGQKPQRCYPGVVIDHLAENLKKEGGEFTISQRPLDYEGWNGLISMHITEKFGSFAISRYNGGYALDNRIRSVENNISFMKNFWSSLSISREIDEIRSYDPFKAWSLEMELLHKKTRLRMQEREDLHAAEFARQFVEREREKARLAALREQEWQREREAQLARQRAQQAYNQQQAEQAAEAERRRQAQRQQQQQARQREQERKRQEEKQRLLSLAWQQAYQGRRPAPKPAASASVADTVIAPHSLNSMKTKGVSPEQNDGGDPVNLMTGNMYHIETDFRYPARGVPLMFTRTYNSLGLENGPLGYGWTHNYHHQLKFVDGADADNKTSNIIWVDGTGAERTIRLFSENITTRGVGTLADKNIMTPPGLYFKLTQTAKGYEIREKNGLVYRFSAVAGKVGEVARLVAISDASGNTQALTYSDNRLARVTDPDQRAIHFSYNTTGQLTQISDWTGNRFQYQYDTQHNLTAVRTPDNTDEAATTYHYYSTSDGPTLDHRMQTFRYANGYQMTFEYYPNGKVFRHTNANNDSMTFKYNTFRRETQTINERGDVERFFFNKKGSLVKKIDLNGGKHLHAYDNSLDPFLRTRYTNPLGLTVHYEYDVSGDLIKTTLPSGDSVTYKGYNRFGQPAVINDAQSNVSLMLYNPQGQLQEQVRFKQGQALPFAYETATAATIAAHADTVIAWTRYHYNALGNLIKKQSVKDFTDPDSGPYVEYDYQDTKNNVKGAYPVSVTYRGDLDGDGSLAEGEGYGPYDFEYDVLGRVLKGYDTARYPFTRQYSSGGRLVSSQDHRGVKTRYQYDPSGLVLGTNQSAFVQGDYEPLGSVTFKYDSANRLIVRADQSGAVTRYQHDPMGNITEITDPDGYRSQREYDPAHQLTAIIGADGRETRYQYDPLGRQIAVLYPGGNTLRYQYHGAEHNGWLAKIIRLDTVGLPTRFQAYKYDKLGQVIELTDNLGRSTLTDYDALGRAIRVVAPVYEDSVFGSVRPVTTYRYNNLGFVIEIHAGHTNATGEVSADQLTVQATYTYDDFGRRLTETNALGHTWRWTYNEHDQIVSLSEPEGQVIRNDYDASGYLSKQSAEHPADSEQEPLSLSYRYNLLGLVTESENADAHFKYRYDPAFRLATVEDLRTGKTLSYDYSLGGLLNRVTDSAGAEIYYQYDPVGRLIGLQTGLKHISFGYDPAGRLASKDLPNQTSTQYSYYPDDSLKSLQVLGLFGPIEQHLYNYNAAGQVSRHLHKQQGVHVQKSNLQDRRYQYDNLDRLTKVFDDERTYDQIDYDPFGNWRQRTQTTKHIIASSPGVSTKAYASKTLLFQHNALHQLTRIHQTDKEGKPGTLVGEYHYNKNGDMTQRKYKAGELNFTYNALGQLIKAQGLALRARPGASPQDLTETYQYGPSGNRLQKTTNGQAIYYRYDRGNHWAEYQDPSASAEAFYIQGPSIDQPLARIDTIEPQYYHSDQLGSITAVTNHLGLKSATQRYNAWGEVQEASPINGIHTYGYAGREPDATGLIYYRSRYYDPSIGRFTQQDSLGFINGVNRYAYVMNNPINYIDPWGTMATGPSRSVNWPMAIENGIRKIVMVNAGFVDTYTGGLTTVGRNALGGRDYTTNSAYQAGEVGAQVVEWAEMVTPLGAAKKGVKAAAIELVQEMTSGCSCCFASGTSVLTADGKQAIETIETGQLVYAKNPETGEVALKPVTDRILTEGKPLYRLALKSTASEEEIIEVTDNHPFWVMGKGWVDSAQLKSGMQVEAFNGQSLEVVSLIETGRTEDTYNLTVADFHTYYAGEQSAFVHNCKCALKGAARKQVMRKEGIPTSQQPVSQSKNMSGREYRYEVPKSGGGTQIKSVQQQTLDRSHHGQGHWEAGTVKVDPLTGQVRMNSYGRPKLAHDKSKVDYSD